ncbi:hypothetical protein HK100_002541 [Physocladia obscura]|uniref:Uncharacterized protein n=1 Tax=Physocladia obscura TaxID=109957 RepID=A0AAD5XFC5_9FUNG|nr:hypothetical protein HK100_002541 [Physocladia obscura]
MQLQLHQILQLPTNKSVDAKSQFVHAYVKSNNFHLDRLRQVLEGYIRNLERIKLKSIKKSGFLKQYADACISTTSTNTPASTTRRSRAAADNNMIDNNHDNEDDHDDFNFMLLSFSNMIVEKEAARDALIARVQLFCCEPLKLYHSHCLKLKEEARNRDLAIVREISKQQQLDKMILKDAGNRPKLNQSQMELAGATHQVAHATENLLQSTEKFELKKRQDVKQILSELLWYSYIHLKTANIVDNRSEIKYHSKVLEILSEHHKQLGNIEFPEVSDFMERFKNFQPPLASPTRSLMSPF